MSDDGRLEDVTTILYLVPFVASGLYGLALWVQGGLSALLPSSVYLTVTRDPFLFAGASLAVMLGLVLEVRDSEPGVRPARLFSLSNTLQSMAVASLVLTFIAALYANGFDLTGAATDFIVGRYGLVFPAVLVLLSYLITARFGLESLRNPKVLGILAMLAVPAVIYELGRRQIVLGLLISLFLLVAGLLPYLTNLGRAKPKAEEQ